MGRWVLVYTYDMTSQQCVARMGKGCFCFCLSSAGDPTSLVLSSSTSNVFQGPSPTDVAMDMFSSSLTPVNIPCTAHVY